MLIIKDQPRIPIFTKNNPLSDEAVSGIGPEIRPISSSAGRNHESEEVVHAIWNCHVHVLPTLSLTSTRHGMVPFYYSDILRSVIMRTKVLMLHLLEGHAPGAGISDLYDDFQDQCTALLSADTLSHLQIQPFMPDLLQLWRFQDIREVNENKPAIHLIAEK
jgi:hypothetical protein